MFEMLNKLAINVEQYVDRQTAEDIARQAAENKEKMIWIIILCVALAAELILAFILPKFLKKFQERKDAENLRKAERKRIQSKRKKEY
ncbi:MAG: hypothetical protein IK955_05275 [Clostridia bacterium]|nr:hypothetical protein [Clostridia bacterium]